MHMIPLYTPINTRKLFTISENDLNIIFIAILELFDHLKEIFELSTGGEVSIMMNVYYGNMGVYLIESEDLLTFVYGLTSEGEGEEEEEEKEVYTCHFLLYIRYKRYHQDREESPF